MIVVLVSYFYTTSSEAYCVVRILCLKLSATMVLTNSNLVYIKKIINYNFYSYFLTLVFLMVR